MDNKQFDITAEDKEEFILSMKIAFGTRYPHKAVAYLIKDGILILFWHKHKDAIDLLYPMDVNETVEFVWGWLQKTAPAEREPDHDGDNGKGFRVFCDMWGHVKSYSSAFVGIRPEWAWYGK